MKTKILYLVVLFLFCQNINSQPLFWNVWQQVPSGTNSNLNFLTSLAPPNFYSGGDNGTLIYSTTFGNSWVPINTGLTASLKGMYMQGISQFAVCGSNGLIAKTTNSGANFNVYSTGTMNTINSVFTAGIMGLAVGDNGTVIQTTNSGTNWSSSGLGLTSNVNHIIYGTFGEYMMIFVGDNGIAYKVKYSTQPVGLSFTQINTGVSLNLKHLFNLNSNIWIAASAGKILHSSNAGINWHVINTGFSNDLLSVHAESNNNIYACGTGGLIIKSTNGGTSFSSSASNTISDLKGIIVKNNTGITVGNSGTTLKCLLGGTGGTFVKQQAVLNPANISTWIWNTGVFNQDLRVNNTPGFSWGPKEIAGSSVQAKFAIFTTGLSLAGLINGNLRMANASYNGEYIGGYIENGIAKTNTNFQVFKVKSGDNCNNSADFANWSTMIPYGAPYSDANGNAQFDACIDMPGIKNAAQTIFVCLTDGFPQTHTTSEGFSGGTAPMKAEVHLTAWAYDTSYSQALADVQFIKWEIINKNDTAWTSFYPAIICDPDLGDGGDDYIGCDSARNLGYCYNADDVDGTGTGRTYGANPPAVGMRMLKTPIRKNSITPDTVTMSSFTFFNGTGQPGPTCQQDPSSAPILAYNFIRGIKKDGTPWLNPTTTPPFITKFCYTGNPETASGWTEYFGRIENCGGATTGNVVPSPPGERRYLMSFGRDNFTVNPGDTQTLVMAQMMAKGANNKNAVTKLKLLSDNVYNIFKSGGISIGINNLQSEIVNSFMLGQNYPNPFNPETSIKFQIPEKSFVSLKVYDITGREVASLVNISLSKGSYEYKWNASEYPSGVYFYKLEAGNYSLTRKMVLVK